KRGVRDTEEIRYMDKEQKRRTEEYVTEQTEGYRTDIGIRPTGIHKTDRKTSQRDIRIQIIDRGMQNRANGGIQNRTKGYRPTKQRDTHPLNKQRDTDPLNKGTQTH
ncbi:hypothetical protein OTU49_017311, partial [Cherax quadricarinatus]